MEVTSNAGAVSSLFIRPLLKENIKVRKSTARESLLLCVQCLLRGLREGKWPNGELQVCACSSRGPLGLVRMSQPIFSSGSPLLTPDILTHSGAHYGTVISVDARCVFDQNVFQSLHT